MLSPAIRRAREPRFPRAAACLTRVPVGGTGFPPRDQPWIETINGMIKIATMFVILIIGLIAGPAVSL